MPKLSRCIYSKKEKKELPLKVKQTLSDRVCAHVLRNAFPGRDGKNDRQPSGRICALHMCSSAGMWGWTELFLKAGMTTAADKSGDALTHR